MKFLLNYHQILIGFLLIPLLIHLLKRMQAKQIMISSLFLLRRKKANVSQKLKLRQIFLLIIRCLVVLSLAVYFLQPILEKAPNWIYSLFPYEDRLTVLLDNRWDDRDSMISKWYRLRGESKSIDVEFINLYSTETSLNLIDQVTQSLKNKTSQYILFSRLYGIDSENLNALNKLPIKIIPFGPSRVDNRGILGAYVDPKVAFVGETIKIIGSTHTNSLESLTTPLSLYENEKKIGEKVLSPSMDSPSNFIFPITITNEQSKSFRLQIPADILKSDDSVSLPVKVKSSFTAVLVDDHEISSQRNSRLYFIKKFLESLQLMFPKTLVRIIDMDSKSWKQSDEKPDWLILGSLNNFVWRRGTTKMLIFPQKDRSIQSQIDQRLGMKSYSIEALPRKLDFPSMITEDKSLYSVPWQIYRYLQFKQENGVKLALANEEVLIFELDDIYFSAFDFSKYDFSGVTHPYFPVFLYQLFLNRFSQIEKSPVLNKESFERTVDSELREEEKTQNMADWSDLSKVFLFFLLISLLLEVILVQNIQKLTSSKT